MSAQQPILAARSVSKRFGATIALKDADLTIHRGQVHALIGENGAGKSTLMKIIVGALRADAGTMTLDGSAYDPRSPLAARDAGVAMIYQELNLAPHLTVAQNLTLGVERRRAGLLVPRDRREKMRAIFAELERPDFPLNRPVRQLSPAQRQLVEIVRALLIDARVIVMDEPTSSLGAADIESLFKLVGRLKQRKVAIVYISHFLEEIERIADRYTVLRDGVVAGSGAMSEASTERLVELMIGRRLSEMFPRVPHAAGPALLSLDALSVLQGPAEVSLTLHRGEILGLAGLVGAGRTELMRAVLGLEPVRSGRVRVADWSTHRPSPPAMLRRGVGLLSEDRKDEGLALTRTVLENLLLADLRRFAKFGWLNPLRLRRVAQEHCRRLAIKTRGPAQRVAALSGGNQQKVAFGRLLAHDCDVLLLDEPTRGIDVGSKAQIYGEIGRLAADGKGVIFVSSYMPELLGVCDRIAVMHRGRIATVARTKDWTEHQLVLAATRGEAEI